MESEFVERRIGGEQLDIIVGGHLLSDLLEDGLPQSIDGLVDLDLEDDLFSVVDEERFDGDEDAFAEVPL